MGDRAHLSIGEVLSLLREEFADITISKIRFLESQGLVDPERTPSGYRKFYDDDVERLRWILRQQREHFLPLKVIKDRLDDDPSESEAAEVAPVAGSGAGSPAPVGMDSVYVPTVRPLTLPRWVLAASKTCTGLFGITVSPGNTPNRVISPVTIMPSSDLSPMADARGSSRFSGVASCAG